MMCVCMLNEGYFSFFFSDYIMDAYISGAFQVQSFHDLIFSPLFFYFPQGGV